MKVRCSERLGLGFFIYWAVIGTLGLFSLGCQYEPTTRTPNPEQLSDEPVQVLSTLDARGEYALLGYPSDEGVPRVAISHWRKGERCDVPLTGEPVAAPLPRARGGKSGPAFYLPVAVPGDAGPELWLVDEQCQPYGPLSGFDPKSARTVIRESDQSGYLLFRDSGRRLYVLDPRTDLSVRKLAREVSAQRATRETWGKERDAVWVVTFGALVLMTLDGEVISSLGSDVQALTLARDRNRIAFVDGRDLYEAVAPHFEASLIVEDGCSARYGDGTLEFFAPCDARTLRRVNLKTGKYQEFAAGVSASTVQEGVQLDTSEDADGTRGLTAQYRDGSRVTIEPTFEPGMAYVLDEQRIAGLTSDGRFGVWQRRDKSFSPMLEGVAELVAHHRGKTHHYAWLAYHDVMDGLGTLTMVDQEGMRSEIGDAVPLPEQRGFVIEDGSALAQYPFSAPLVVLLKDAREVPGAPFRFCGWLWALSINGTPHAALAKGVCSYAIVAAPVPGVLYGVENGPGQGLYFVSL